MVVQPLLLQTQAASLSRDTLFTSPLQTHAPSPQVTPPWLYYEICVKGIPSAQLLSGLGDAQECVGQTMSGGVARRASEHRAGMLGPSKRFCDTWAPPTSSEVEIIMYTQQSRRPHPVSVNAQLQKTACWSFLDFKSTHASKLLKGMGDAKHTYRHEYFNIYPAQWLMSGSSILLLYPWYTGLKEDFQVVSFVCLSMRGCCVCAFVIFLLVLALAHAGPCEGLLGAAKAELSADNAGWLQVPAVITNRPPLAVLQHLHPPLAKPGAPLQPHISLESRQGHSSIGNKLRHVN